nr:MAG TPA: hypothetical protein [Caudoviricetes sp.]
MKILRNAKINTKIFGVLNSTLYLCSINFLFYIKKVYHILKLEEWNIFLL